MFDFDKVNEKTGVDGLFEEPRKVEALDDSFKEKLLYKINQEHRKKLQDAREYKIGKERKKRALEEEASFPEREQKIKSQRINSASQTEGDELKSEQTQPKGEISEENTKIKSSEVSSQDPDSGVAGEFAPQNTTAQLENPKTEDNNAATSNISNGSSTQDMK